MAFKYLDSLSQENDANNPQTLRIRLLKVLPARRKSSPVHCQLETVRLLDASDYEALSYCWGDPHPSTPIHLSSVSKAALAPDSESQLFPVGPNLHSALRHLRYTKNPRTFWIDAICIDQSNEREKATQIKSMGEVYGRARQVVIWLGEEADKSHKAFKMIARWAKIDSVEDFMGLTGYSGPKHPVADGSFTTAIRYTNPKHMEAIQKLLGRPWWQRVWVVQEFVLAQEAVLVCGEDKLNWVDFSEAMGNMTMVLDANVLDHRIASTIALHNQVDVVAMSKLRQNFKSGLEDILEMTANRYRATKTCDLVYGLLGFDSGRNKIDIAVRNDLTDSQVFTDLFRSIAEQNHSIRPLCRAGIGLRGRTTKDLPSFVPDLAYVSQEQRHWSAALMGAARADGGRKCDVRISTGPKPMMTARGNIVDRVSRLRWVDQSPATDPSDTLLTWFCCSRWHRRHMDDPTGCSKTRAFFNTLIGYLPRSGGPNGMRGAYRDLACGFMLVMGDIASNASNKGFLNWLPPEAHDTYLRLESVLAAYKKRLSSVVKGLAYLTLVAKWMDDDDLCNDSAQQWVLMLEEEEAGIESVIMSAFLGPEGSFAQSQWYSEGQRNRGSINGLIPIPPFTIFDNSRSWSGPKRGAHLGQDTEDARNSYRFWEHWLDIAGRFEFFITEEGYMGIGPSGLGSGDFLCVLDGCPMPMAIRIAWADGLHAEPGLRGSDLYKVVGSCYIHGAMLGEPLGDCSSNMLVFV